MRYCTLVAIGVGKHVEVHGDKLADVDEAVAMMNHPLMVANGDPMTIRDHFAAAALQGWAAGRNRSMDGAEMSDPAYVAGTCYGYADAMLAERAKVMA